MILLSIAKAIGYIILIILALLLIFSAVVLICPIRYWLDGSYHGTPEGEIRMRYAPVGLRAEAVYRNGELQYTVCLLGGVIFTNTGRKISRLGRKLFSESGQPHEEKTDSPNSGQMPDGNETETPRIAQANTEAESQESVGTRDKGGREKEKRKSPFARLREKFRQLQTLLQTLRKKKDALLRVLRSDRFAAAKRDGKEYLRTLFRILRPSDAKGEICFGMEDPATTGEILGGLSLILPLYQNYLMIRPDFERKCFDGELRCSGKVIPARLVRLAIRVIRNQNIIKVVKKVQTIIEA